MDEKVLEGQLQGLSAAMELLTKHLIEYEMPEDQRESLTKLFWQLKDKADVARWKLAGYKEVLYGEHDNEKR